jgi:acetolactate synthase-1/2/3 large subunit
VLTTANGKGVVPEDDPLSLGASVRLPAAHEYLESCDAVLVVGTELGDSDLWRDAPLRMRGSVIRLDIDPDQRDKNADAEVSIVADAAAGLGALAAELAGMEAGDRGAGEADELRARLRAEALLDAAPYEALIAALEAGLPPGGIVCGDSTMACYYGAVHLLPLTEPRRLLYPTGFATLGYAIPAAVGAKLAQPECGVVALIGDGGAMFTLPELAVAAELGLPIAVVVVNDGGYGEIRRQMAERSQPLVGVDLTPPDFPGAARALGADGVLLDDPGELSAAVARAFAASGPTLIEIRVG